MITYLDYLDKPPIYHVSDDNNSLPILSVVHNLSSLFALSK